MSEHVNFAGRIACRSRHQRGVEASKTARMRGHALALVAIMIGTSCNRDEPVSPRAGVSVPATARKTVRESRFVRPGEEEFLALARSEPAIAGFFVDSQGGIGVYITDSTRLGRARGQFINVS